MHTLSCPTFSARGQRCWPVAPLRRHPLPVRRLRQPGPGPAGRPVRLGTAQNRARPAGGRGDRSATRSAASCMTGSGRPISARVGLQGNELTGSPGSPLTVNQVPFTFSLDPK